MDTTTMVPLDLVPLDSETRKNIFEKHSSKFITIICLLSAITFIGCIASDASKEIPVSSEDEQ